MSLRLRLRVSLRQYRSVFSERTRHLALSAFGRLGRVPGYYQPRLTALWSWLTNRARN